MKSSPTETSTPPAPPPVPKQPPAGRKFPCRQCGARLDFDPSVRALKCPYCGFVENIEPASDKVQENSWDDYWSKQHDQEGVTLEGHTTEVRCAGCGAVILFDDKIVTESCPYCSTHLENKPERARGMIKPEAVLPFEVTQRKAVQLFNVWIASRWFAPSTLKKFANLGQLTGMYVPFWTYDSMTYSAYSGERGDDYLDTETYTETNAQGQLETKTRTVTRTRWSYVSGEVDHFFDDVLICASRSLPEGHVDQLTPWDLDQLVNYKAEYLSGFVTERYAVDLKEGFGEAKEIMDGAIRSLCRRDIGGDHQRVHSVQTQHVGVTFKHLLLPVWVAPYRYHDKPFQILVNARTGEVVGSRPYSWVKIIFLIVFIVVLLGMLLFFYAAAQGAPPSSRSHALRDRVSRSHALRGNADRDALRRGAAPVTASLNLDTASVRILVQGADAPRSPEKVYRGASRCGIVRQEEENEGNHGQSGSGRRRVAGRRARLPARAAA